jgi:hypothetical protein
MISSEYISKDRLVYFEKIKEITDFAYNRVVESLREKSLLPYMPNIYPVPFMIVKTYFAHASMIRVLFYSTVYPEGSNFERFAIYPNLNLIERMPEHLTGVIGHEMAHIIALGGKVSISNSDLYSVLRNRQDSAKSKEEKAKAAYRYFNEPVLSEIIKWDRISIQKEVEQIVTKDVQLISQQDFDRIIFKENLEKYHDFVKSKLAESVQWR